MKPSKARKLRRALQHRFLDNYGLQVVRSVPDWELRVDDHALRQRALARVAEIWEPSALVRSGSSDFNLEATISEFDSLIQQAPVRQTGGGNGLGGLMNLFIVLRLTRPTTVVESGVFKGLSTWTIRQALPDVKIHSFDISFAVRAFKDPQATYYEHDWTDPAVPLLPERSLCFFDDHVSQASRLRQAIEAKAQFVFFDDDYPAELTPLDAAPAAPTASMVFDDRTTADFEAFSSAGKRSIVAPTLEDKQLASAVLSYTRIPDSSGALGLQPVFQSLVETRLGGS